MTGESSGRDPRPVGDALQRLVAELGLGDVASASSVQAHWERAVGVALAAHAQPSRLRDGVLTVEVDGPAWATEVRYLGAELAARLNAAVGHDAVRSVRVVVRPR